jgi:transglutaminase-like putative cysteine protease
VILEIRHETRLRYSRPVTEWAAEFRMEPVSDAEQTCHAFDLKCNPPTGLYRYTDGFGNRVHSCNVRAPAEEIRLLAACLVETHPGARDLDAVRTVLPLNLDAAGLQVLEYTIFRGPVRPAAELGPLLEAVKPQTGATLGTFMVGVSHHLHVHFEYAKDVTSSSSPVDDVLRLRKGVCQDFAHLMLAVMRSYGVPARYVSGYLHRPNKESQSHAWVEVWTPEQGWCGIDPTNDCVVNEHFVKVAVGRDFTDVPPNKGVYRGIGEETIGARVETRLLERLPPLSWQEQLPPMQVPLTAIRKTMHAEPTTAEEAQQQQ